MQLSPLQKQRLKYNPKLPAALAEIQRLGFIEVAAKTPPVAEEIQRLFPLTSEQETLVATIVDASPGASLRIGVVFSGGQAAGGHNVVTGMFDALQKGYPGSKLYGFLGGPSGILEDKYIEISEAVLAPYRNQGGFDLLGSGRTKIDKPEQFAIAAERMRDMSLDGMVIIGGDDSNTNAALMAEYFLAHGIDTRVVGVPKTIDGDLRGHGIEISFGYDTAWRTYAATIGSLARDALSAGKYYYFVKLMGRSASHVTLECALATHPNMALIGEEIAANKTTLAGVVDMIASMIIERSERGKEYGVVLIPEGVIEFIGEMKRLIEELNMAAARDEISDPDKKIAGVESHLSEESRMCFGLLPREIKLQLLLGRDPHGNVQVSKIETERMLIVMVQDELKKRGFTGKFNPQPIFCGYEGRSCMPTNFDADYCYALGHIAVALVGNKKTGYVCSIGGLTNVPDVWQCGAVPLVCLMGMETRAGKTKPVIEKALVDLHGPQFTTFAHQRQSWALEDAYQDPGPIQFS